MPPTRTPVQAPIATFRLPFVSGSRRHSPVCCSGRRSCGWDSHRRIATAQEISLIYPFGLHTEQVGRLGPVDYGLTKKLNHFNFVTVSFHERLAIVRELRGVGSLLGALGLFFTRPAGAPMEVARPWRISVLNTKPMGCRDRDRGRTYARVRFVFVHLSLQRKP